MTLVVDASVAFAASGVNDGFAVLGEDLAAPALMWSETRSSLRLRGWQGVLSQEEVTDARMRLEWCPVQRHTPAALGEEAWRIADEMGWARTYDAEYLALARLLGRRVVTLDARLRRGADRLGLVVSPSEL